MATTYPIEGQLVLCGSMSAYSSLRAIQEELEAAGVRAVIPTEDDYNPGATIEETNKAKRIASKNHFDCIKNERTTAILVVNVDKDGKHDYIGPNSFAEIAVAFASNVAIYLLQDVPVQYRDELDAWGARSLKGNLEPLTRRFASIGAMPRRLAHVG